MWEFNFQTTINNFDCLKEGKFPSGWKKVHVVPVHKKGNKQYLKNYKPIFLLPICNKQYLKNYKSIFLLPICSKLFEHFIYNELFAFVIDNKLISPNHSGLKPGVSCVNQLLAITHEIYKSFDDDLEVRGFS